MKFLIKVAANVWQAHPPQGSSAQQTSRLTAGPDHTDSPARSSLIGGPLGEDEFLSKPGTLLSCNAVVLRPSENPAFLAPVPEEPYSGDSARLQMSSSCWESTEPSGTTVPTRNEPEEDQYDSIQQSLLSQDVRVSVGHVSEDAPFPNYTGQDPPASNQHPSLMPTQNHSPSGSERDQRPGFPYNLLENYYVPAAAIAGLFAVVMLWKLKN